MNPLSMHIDGVNESKTTDGKKANRHERRKEKKRWEGGKEKGKKVS